MDISQKGAKISLVEAQLGTHSRARLGRKHVEEIACTGYKTRAKSKIDVLYRNDRLTQFSKAERKMFNSPKIMSLVPDYIRACDGHNFKIGPCSMTYSQIPVDGLSSCWHKTSDSPWVRQSML